MYSTHIIVFPDSSLVGPKAEKLKTFANYMVSFDVQDRLWNELKVFPVDQKAYENALANMEPELRPMLEQLGQGRAMPSERAMSYTWGAMAKSYSRFMNDILTAEEAAELMQKLAERELSKDK
jgi:maltose-binding protein MalE